MVSQTSRYRPARAPRALKPRAHRLSQVVVGDVLLGIPGQQWKVDDQGQPVPVDEEQEG